ncbi:hypothetical protein GQ53DRAFT_806670 [Thozetella sp. PMI_491]|nr:hypothetical protein GQ53DRAFT_806670 [Thozetella sp. PMI_491]
MASDGVGVTPLSAATITPIAQLEPELSEQATRAVRGEITITWPFNSVAKTFAFILAESDVRLRRERGQVRVQLQGSSAKALAETGCGGGDELFISLDGVEWVKDELPARGPGSRVHWQLQFSEKLTAQVKLCDANETKLVKVDHPDVDDSRPFPIVETTSLPEPETEPDLPLLSPAGRPPLKYTEEFRSPAFIKRARVSYGSLFEDGLDIFEEDGGVRGRGRKRSRFTLESTAWRYSSQSRSPEPETQAQDRAGQDVSPSSPPLKPSMTHGTCQAMETDVPHATTQPVGRQSPPGSNDPLPGIHSSVLLPEEANGGAALLSLATEHQKTPAIESYSLFGTYVPSTPAIPSSISGEEQATAAPLDPSMSLSDQVRFGFSHDPQLIDPSASTILSSHGPTTQLPAFDREDAYPDSYLDRPSNAEYPDLQPYASGPEQQDSQPAYQYALDTPVPVPDSFERSQWDIPAHGERYIPVEADQYSGDALVEDRTFAEAVTQPESMPNIETPAGFDSYGGHDSQNTTLPEVIDVDDESSDGDDGQPLVENEETYDSEDEVGVQDEDDAVYDEDGDEIEQGDYDQREYDAPSDDDEGSSEEEEEVEQEVRERYAGNGAYEEEEEEEYSSAEGYEDEEQGPESGDEEDEDEEYDESEEDEIPASRPAQPAVPKTPVVISLLDSSDEEDDQPPPAPRPAPAPRPIPVNVPVPATTPVPATVPVAPFSQPSPAKDTSTGSEPQTEAFSRVQQGSPPADENSGRDHPQDQGQASVKDASPVSYSQTQVIDFALRSEPSGGQPTMKVSEVHDEASGPDTPLQSKEDALFDPAQAVSSTHAEADQGDYVEALQTSDHEPSAGIDRDHDLEDVGDPMDEDTGAEGDLVEPDAVTRQHVLGEDIVMEDEQDEQDDEASDEGLFARRPRSRTPVEKDPDYVDQPDDEIIEEEYEIDKVNDLAGLDAATENVESSPRPAAIHAAERTAEQLQEIEEALEQDQPASPATRTASFDHQQESDSILPGSPADLEQPDDDDAPTTNAIENHAIVAEELVEPNDQTEPQGLLEQEVSLAAEEVVSHPPHLEVTSPSVEPSTSHPNALATDSPLGQHEPIAPAGSVSPQNKSEREQEERGAVLLPSPIEDQPSNPTEEADQQGDEEITVAVQRPPGPFQEEEAETSELPLEPDEVVAAQEATHEASPVAAELVNEDVIMGEVGDDGDQEFGSVPSPSTQLWGEMGATESPVTGTTPAPTDDHANGITTLAADDLPVDKALPTSSPGPSSSQDVHEGVRRSSRRAKTSAIAALEELASQNSTQDSEQQPSSQSRRKKATTPDPSIQYARQSLAAKRTKKAPEPIQSSPRTTRARSSSLQTTATTEDEADQSIALARAALASPSKTGRKSGKSATTLKGELSKRLKSDLPECLSLKSLRSHLKKPITAVGIATTQPSRPSRAKTGSREWVMSFNITDVAIAPAKVVEVQFYRANKDSLPSVKPGDGILLQNFQVQAVASKDFGLRSINSSSWAVFDVEDGPPQIKGPPVEDYDQYSDYMETLKEWYRALGASATEKLEKANQEMSQEGSSK